MPIFKALASIAAWILFIGGCISILLTTITVTITMGLIGEPSITAYIGWGLGAADLTLATVIMRLRQKME